MKNSSALKKALTVLSVSALIFAGCASSNGKQVPADGLRSEENRYDLDDRYDDDLYEDDRYDLDDRYDDDLYEDDRCDDDRYDDDWYDDDRYDLDDRYDD